jgi:hypothetical protein
VAAVSEPQATLEATEQLHSLWLKKPRTPKRQAEWEAHHPEVKTIGMMIDLLELWRPPTTRFKRWLWELSRP